MYEIEIRNSCIVLHNYTPGDNQRLENIYSVWDKTRHKRIPMALYYDFKNKNLFIPGGTQLYLASVGFNNNILPKPDSDPYDSIGQVMLKVPPRDDRQKKAIRFCIGLEEYHNNRNFNQLSLNLSTGVGKTYVAIFTFAFFCIRTICIMSSNSWMEQWRQRILEYTDLRNDEIYTIEGSPTIHKLLNGMKDISKIRFILCTHSTLLSWAKQHGWESIGDLFRKLRIGLRLYDESHLNFENICKIDFFTNTWKTYYLTATPQKSDFFQNKIYQRAFETIPKINLFKEEDRHTRYLGVLINSHPSGFDIEKCTNMNYGFSSMNYASYFVQKDVHYKILRILLAHCFSEMEPGQRVLIYIATNQAVQQTYNWLKYYYYPHTIGIYTSIVPKEEKQKQLEAEIILTTTKSAGVLLDIPNLKKTIILNEPFNSFVYARQILGRTRASDTELIEVVDCGFQRIKEWYQNKVRNVYNKYATDVKQITYSDIEINQTLLDMERQEQEARKLKKRKTVVYKDGKPVE